MTWIALDWREEETGAPLPRPGNGKWGRGNRYRFN